ncbi:MAG TPA: DMT family transporter [Euzebyales bacterium]|nr:DMT family transporter [Euzebyales bacterium]
MTDAARGARAPGRVGATMPGVVLVGLAAALWGTDGLFRQRLALELPAATVVAWEHAIVVVLLIPVFARMWRAWQAMPARDRVAVAVIGIGASAVATTLFTAAFRFGDPVTPLLLQKLQPLIAVAGAHVLLGERLTPRFLWFLVGGLGGAWLITFADPTGVTAPAAAAGALALGAAILWGLGTVLGRGLATNVAFVELTTMRFVFGLPAAALIAVAMDGPDALTITGGEAVPLIALALIPGLLALLLYYRGLHTTPASAATIAELTFPLTAITLGAVVFGTTLTPTQWLGAGLLVATITTMALLARRGNRGVGIAQRRPALLGGDGPLAPAEPAGAR